MRPIVSQNKEWLERLLFLLFTFISNGMTFSDWTHDTSQIHSWRIANQYFSIYPFKRSILIFNWNAKDTYILTNTNWIPFALNIPKNSVFCHKRLTLLTTFWIFTYIQNTLFWKNKLAELKRGRWKERKNEWNGEKRRERESE